MRRVIIIVVVVVGIERVIEWMISLVVVAIDQETIVVVLIVL